MMNILCSAQQFGYGPMAELCALGRAFQLNRPNTRVNLFLRHHPYLSALEIESSYFDFFNGQEDSSSLQVYLRMKFLEKIDAVLSSYDPAAIFFGWYVSCPTFLYDGLFWFWNFERHSNSLQKYLGSLHEIRERRDDAAFVKEYEKIQLIDHHLLIFLAYHLCTSAYVRSGIGIESRLLKYPEIGTKTQIVGAVIDPTISKCVSFARRTHILFSLSGSLAPILTFGQNLNFARGALLFALEAREFLGINLPIFFCCHPKIYEVLLKEGCLCRLPSNFFVVPSFDYYKNLEMIKNSYAMFVSPGFSSIQEAAYFRTPIFFLPEQNGGQPAQLHMLQENGYDISNNWTVTQRVYDGKSVIGENDVVQLYQGIEKLWDNSMRLERIASIKNFGLFIGDSINWQSLVENQRRSVLSIFGDFNGAQEITQSVVRKLMRN
jgi:hypothetical protein